MNVADMWACLQDHDPDNHWRHVAGWRKISELADQHLHRLRTYRQRLAPAWPPETNEAARAYLAELDDLIAQVQRTHDAASANQSALAAATQALTSTRTELKKIHDEYADKLQRKRGWEQTAADPKAVAGSRTSQPPVTDADLEQLNVKARGIMYGLSSDLQQAQVTLRQPPPAIRRQPARDQTTSEVQVGDGTPLPVIPPIVPVPARLSNTPGTIRQARLSQSAVTPTGINLGPVLGNANPAPTPANPMPPSTTPAAAPGINVQSMPSASFVTRHLASEQRHIQPGQAKQPEAGRPSSTPRLMPPGGIIGGPPLSGIGQTAAGTGQPRTVNPIGGVIGGGAAGTAPTGGAGSRPGSGRGLGTGHAFPPFGGSPHSGVSIARGSHGSPERSGQPDSEPKQPRRWDPEHPWEIDQGVSPVVRPPDDDGPIDPGPAIGLNR
ncbi:hypothetical protein D0Q02_24830 [Micromonospora craniellae]|uniref:PPE domain-containing protein n=1 Tax=Micromonospora craniellae TaxID=2294034 RepID=A0A372FTV7_9ACTN|nr:hypothetical protein D0Q02_24830 [Micromonospora craniellae]